MQIVIEGVSDTIKALNLTMEPIVKKIDNLAEIGIQTAESVLTGENSDVRVYKEKTHNGFNVVAEGTQIGFAEFGAGIGVSKDAFAEDVPYRVFEGSYSREHHGLYAKKGYWYYKGKKYTYIRPKRPMLKALTAMQNEVARW